MPSHIVMTNSPTTRKHAKYDILVPHLHGVGWNTLPPIIVTVGIRGAIHQPSIDHLLDLDIPTTKIKTLVGNIAQTPSSIAHTLYSTNHNLGKHRAQVPLNY